MAARRGEGDVGFAAVAASIDPGASRPPPRRAVRACVVALGFVLVACDGAPSTLDPAGPGARRIAGLWWFMFWLAAAVVVAVTALMLVSVFRRKSEHAWAGDRFVIVAGVVVPSLVLAGVFLVGVKDLRALSDRGEDAALTIDVDGRLWWWEVSYPGTDAVTANEVHIPAGEPVRLRLTAREVIHSFWVPRLQAKTDMIPGRTNEMWIEAERPGNYRGQCAEFCGLQHAKMAISVVAHSRPDFERWLEEQSAPAEESGVEQPGMRVFLESSCAGCHTVRGTEATARVGPDLTHVASRKQLAAGTIPNTRVQLERWIVDPQGVKPGNPMPPTDLDPDELSDLLDYLEGLE